MAELTLKMLAEQLAQVKAENERIREELQKCQADAQRSDDYRQIMNAMAAHVYGYFGQWQEREIEEYWAKAPDIAYAHGELCYFGQDGVRGYYAETTKRLHQAQRDIVKEVYGIELGPDEVPGYKCMNLLASPFIEIARDRKTAQGIFMTLGAKTRLNLKGKPQDGGAGLGMYAADFINENGVWKLWHRVDYPGFDGPLFGTPDGLEPVEESFEDFCKAFPVVPPTKAAHAACNTRTIRMDFDESKQYPFAVSRPAPHMPKPYDTWNDEQSFAHVIKDTYEEKIPMHFDDEK